MDLILYNGTIVTGDESRPEARAVALKDGRIAAVGGNTEMLALRETGTELLDLRARCTVPGFNDSHMHLLGYAMSKETIDLRCCTSINQLIGAVREHIRIKNPARGAWVFGRGWNQAQFTEWRMPTREDLDRASVEHKLVLTRTCGHVCAVNTAALRAAGIETNPPVVEGGSIEVDVRGNPTGILKEKAMDLVLKLRPPLDKKKLKKLICSAAEDFVRAGLTSVQTDDLPSFTGDMLDLLDAYRELEAAGRLPLRVNAQLLLSTPAKLDTFLASGYRTGDGGDYFKIGPLKLLTDGSLGGRTAALSSPYTDNPGDRGIPLFRQELLEELVEKAHAAGMQVATHAIGDRAVDMVLDAFRRAQKLHPRPDPRFRIIHASLVRSDQLERIRTQGIAADIQPAFVPSDYHFIEERLGRERIEWLYRWRDFILAGIPLGGGSDCPVETFNPLAGLRAAVTRQDAEGNPPGGWRPEQKLEVAGALRLFTLGSAYCTFEEKVKGSITPGKLADLVVLAEDIRRVDPGEIEDIPVEHTITGGKLVYSRRV